MPSAQVWSGIAQGLSTLATDMSQADLRATQLSEAKARQQKAELELKEYTDLAPSRQKERDFAMQKLEAQTYGMNTQLTKQQTFDAFTRFEADKDVRHLNTWLTEVKRNPVGASIYGDVVRIDSLQKSTENDQLLRSMGYTDLDAVYSNPELSKDLVLITGTNKRGIININDMYASTGYTKYLTNEKLTELERKARIAQSLRRGQSGAKVTLQERIVDELISSGKAQSIAEAYQMIKDMDSSGKGRGVVSSTEEKAVTRIMEENNVDYLEALDMYYSTRRQGSGTTNESRFIEQYQQNNPGATYQQAAAAYRNLAKTSTQKEVADVQILRKGLDEMNWLETKVSDMSQVDRTRVYRDYISPLEDLRGFKLSAEDKRVIRNLRDLTALGSTAGTTLTQEETGLIDSTLSTFKKYVYNEVGGKTATSSYETFRNIFRNALYGASLTQAEITAFNKAAGTLGQQLQPVLAQLQTQMKTIKMNLEAIRDLNDPDIAHYYLGAPIEDIDKAIAAIDERLTDPRLLSAPTKDKEVVVQRVQSQAKPKLPDASTPAAQTFDFDKAMKESGL